MATVVVGGVSATASAVSRLMPTPAPIRVVIVTTVHKPSRGRIAILAVPFLVLGLGLA